MFERITWDEFLDWVRLYDVEPWGELRADARNSVAIAYHLAAWGDGEQGLPNLTWPYYGDRPQDSIDLLAAQQAIQATEAALRAQCEAELTPDT